MRRWLSWPILIISPAAAVTVRSPAVAHWRQPKKLLTRHILCFILTLRYINGMYTQESYNMLTLKQADRLAVQFKEKLQALSQDDLARQSRFVRRTPRKLTPLNFLIGF
jgi:hypothetical protein